MNQDCAPTTHQIARPKKLKGRALLRGNLVEQHLSMLTGVTGRRSAFHSAELNFYVNEGKTGDIHK